MEANGPKNPVNCPEVSRCEGAPQKKKEKKNVVKKYNKAKSLLKQQTHNSTTDLQGCMTNT